MKLYSPAFAHQGSLPARYTCVGEGVSPPLKWEGVPEGTKSFVLICDDPDAPGKTRDHWVLYNIPAPITEIGEGSSSGENGINSWGQGGYGGPCPPSGEHRYFFKLYALDSALKFKEPPLKQNVEQSMKGHVLATADLVGRFRKP